MKLRLFGLIAALIVLTVPVMAASQSDDCRCKAHTIVRRVITHPKPHKTAVRPMPRREARHTIVVHKSSRIVRARARDRYASSYYDYRSSSRVTETIEQRQDGMSRRHWRMDDGGYNALDKCRDGLTELLCYSIARICDLVSNTNQDFLASFG